MTNLSEDTRESDLQELFRPFGPISRIFLAKDKHTNQSKVIFPSSFLVTRKKAAFLMECLRSYMGVLPNFSEFLIRRQEMSLFGKCS